MNKKTPYEVIHECHFKIVPTAIHPSSTLSDAASRDVSRGIVDASIAVGPLRLARERRRRARRSTTRRRETARRDDRRALNRNLARDAS